MWAHLKAKRLPEFKEVREVFKGAPTATATATDILGLDGEVASVSKS